MILRLTTMYENGEPPLSPLGEGVAHDGAFISRRGPGEGVPIFMAARNLALIFVPPLEEGKIPGCARNDTDVIHGFLSHSRVWAVSWRS